MNSQLDRTTRGDDMQSPAVPGDYVTGGAYLPTLDDGEGAAWCIQSDTGVTAEERAELMGGGFAYRGAVLLEAHRIINGERQQQYGIPEDTHAVIAKMWSGYLAARESAGCGKPLDASDVAHMMVLFKLARQINGAGKRDNYVDAAGYIACAADMEARKNA